MGVYIKMPQNSKRSAEKIKTRSSAAKTASNSTARKAGAKKRPVKKQGSRGSAGAGKKRTSQRKRKKQNTAWWCWPVTIIMLFILGVVGVTVAVETKNYEEFKMMRSTVSFDGFHQGVSIDGVDVGGRQQGEVLMNLKNQEMHRRIIFVRPASKHGMVYIHSVENLRHLRNMTDHIAKIGHRHIHPAVRFGFLYADEHISDMALTA